MDLGLFSKALDAAWEYRKPLGEFLSALRRQPVALITSIALFVASLLLVNWYRYRASAYEALINRTLGAETEDTPQSHKGLEAFIFSNVRLGLDDQLRKAHFDSDFVQKYTSFKEAIANAHEALTHLPAQVELTVAPNGVGDIYTDTASDTPGYLFLPTYLLHGEPSVSKGIASISDTALVRAVVFGRSVAGSLQRLSDTAIIAPDEAGAEVQLFLQPSTAQVYLITVEGVNRIFNRKAEHPSAEYGNQFPAKTFFPSRPYFWPALGPDGPAASTNPNGTENIGTFFHVSKPYLDLGGSGVVITLSRAIIVDGVTAVLCIDIQLDSTQKNVYTDLAQSVRSLGGTAAYLTCTIRAQSNPECPGETTTDDEEKKLIKRLKNALATGQYKKSWSTILGNLYVFAGGPLESRLRFSVPISQEFSGSDQKVQLLLVDVDLNAYRDRTSLIALGAATCFGVMTVLLAYLWGSNVMQRKDLAAALERVAEVMSFCPTPYLRLDSTDKIRDASASLCALLGITPSAENIALLKQKTFRSHCADALSEAEYDRVEARRREGLPVGEYVLELRRTDQSTVRVRVHSAALPKTEDTGLPETFGILVEQITPKTAQDGDNRPDAFGSTSYHRSAKQ
jgi:PAS domain-containing protein